MSDCGILTYDGSDGRWTRIANFGAGVGTSWGKVKAGWAGALTKWLDGAWVITQRGHGDTASTEYKNSFLASVFCLFTETWPSMKKEKENREEK